MSKELIYLVWNVDDAAEENHFWEQFDTLTDAVTNHPGEEVFTARPRLLGRFRVRTSPIRLRKRKKK